jgi:hypothetical protein
MIEAFLMAVVSNQVDLFGAWQKRTVGVVPDLSVTSQEEQTTLFQ